MNEGGKGNGGSMVLSRGNEFYVHTRVRGMRAFDLVSGNKTAFMTNEPVLDGQYLFVAETKSTDGKKKDESTDAPATAVPVVRAYRVDNKELAWEVEGVDGSGDIIKMGDRLYMAGGQRISALQLKGDSERPDVVWSVPVEHDIQRLLAASGKLFAVTLDGSILCFGRSGGDRVLSVQADERRVAEVDPRLATLIKKAEISQGYVLVFGTAPKGLVDGLLQETESQIVVVHPDADRIAKRVVRMTPPGCMALASVINTVRSIRFRLLPTWLAS